MKKLSLLLSVVFMMTACIVEEEKKADQGMINDMQSPPVDCSDAYLISECDENEIQVENCDDLENCRSKESTCGYGIVYCQKAESDCIYDSPVCGTYANQVETCDGLSDCYRNIMCGETYFCQITPECVGYVVAEDQSDGSDTNTSSSKAKAAPAPDASSGAPMEDPLPAPPTPFAEIESTNVISACDPADMSDYQCLDFEVDENRCFLVKTEHPCFGADIQFCRPMFEGACATNLVCQEGDTQVSSCLLSDEDRCYTVNSCAGTIYCEKQETTCTNAQVPDNMPVLADCESGVLNSQPCSDSEISQNLCGAVIVPNDCMGSDLFYCHQEIVNCDAYPSCQNFEQEVASCNGLENCAPVTLCGSTIYCQTKPECVDATGGQQAGDPIPPPSNVMPNRVDSCDTNALSNLPCTENEVTNHLCFAYENVDACFGYQVEYCRPRYEGACAFLVRCDDGDLEIDHCYVGDPLCYTVTSCAGTVFCKLQR
jgi:hypothetical protein